MATTEERVENPCCTRCGRVVEWCSLCDREGCPECLCYRCTGLALEEFTPQPHPHGG